MRITSVVLLFMVAANVSVTIGTGMGLWDAVGVQPAPGIEREMTSFLEAMQQGFEPGGGLGETLFGLFAAAGSAFSLFVQTTYAFPTMMLNLGFPGWMVFPIFAPMYVISFLDLVYAFTNRAL